MSGVKGATKLTEEVAARIRELDGRGLSLAAIGAAVRLSTATVRVALGRRTGSAGWEARRATTTAPAVAGDTGEAPGSVEVLPVLPVPEPRTAERGPSGWSWPSTTRSTPPGTPPRRMGDRLALTAQRCRPIRI